MHDRAITDAELVLLARAGEADALGALLLRHFTRCRSYQAIAAVTGVPVGTVRSRLSRAEVRDLAARPPT